MTNFALVPIPMFLLMGELFYHTGLAAKCFNAADKLLGNVRGRLAYVTLIGGTAFAGPAGSSMGACALLGTLMVPGHDAPRLQQVLVDRADHGRRRACGDHPALGAHGAACHAGRTDVADLLIAGVIPGFLLALMYGVLIWGWTIVDPSAAPPYAMQKVPAREKVKLFFLDVIPMVGIIVFSVVIMIVGWCTPTEAAALGAVSVMVLAACYRTLTLKALLKSLDGTLRVTVMAFLIISDRRPSRRCSRSPGPRAG